MIRSITSLQTSKSSTLPKTYQSLSFSSLSASSLFFQSLTSSLSFFSPLCRSFSILSSSSSPLHMTSSSSSSISSLTSSSSSVSSIQSSPFSSSSSSSSTPPSPSSSSSSSSSSDIPTTPYTSSPSSSSSGFRLSSRFLNSYRSLSPPFGFNGLGELVYRRTYSRPLPPSSPSSTAPPLHERWHDTVERVVNGTFTMQRKWIDSHQLGWSPRKSQRAAQEMFDRIFHMKFLPPGRGLWAMGSPITQERNLFAALNNCAFVSTDAMKDDPCKPFCFLMDMSMLGVGVGFDTKGGEGKMVMVKGPSNEYKMIDMEGNQSDVNHNIPNDNHPPPTTIPTFTIPDTREGWVESLHLLLSSYFDHLPLHQYNYSQIRPYGTPIKGFGGLASGPAALKDLLRDVKKVLDRRVGSHVTITDIVDIMNLIGKCVVAGNVRRCLPAHSAVHTRNGIISIKDVKVGMEVLTSDGYKKVINWWEQGMRDIVSINTVDGRFLCTDNHRMAVREEGQGQKGNGKGYKWVEAGQLASGDVLMTSRVPIEGEETLLPSLSGITSPLVVDEELSWLIGMMRSPYVVYHSGNDIDIHHGMVNFTLPHCDDEQMRRMEERIGKVFSRFGNLQMTSHPMGDEEYRIQIQFSSSSSSLSSLSSYFHQHIIPSPSPSPSVSSPHGSPLRIPSYILRAKQSVKLSYISGIMDSHHHPYSDLSPSLSLSLCHSRDINDLYDIQTLLYSCGIESRVSTDNNNLHSLEAITERSIQILKSIPQMIQRISSPSKDQNQIISDSLPSSFHSTPILSITPHSHPLYTYDIQVEHNEEFYCNGYLTHNTAEISFGDPLSDEYLDLKNYQINPQRAAWGWTSNNSVYATLGMDYNNITKRILMNGEPGLAWLENMKSYGRMNGTKDNKDHRAKGGNPCLEQTLESYELCCLVETFPARHTSKEDFIRTLKSAYLYAKTVTLGQTQWPETNRVMLRNRRIGTSVSGIAQFLSTHSIEELREWLDDGYSAIQQYDTLYSDWLAIPKSIKTTSVKPSGTVSLLAGATPGMHYPESRFYIRRIRISTHSPLLSSLRKAGYPVELVEDGDQSTSVVEIPIDAGEGIRTSSSISMWEQLSLAAFLQRHWADNQVSATVTFDPKKEGGQLAHALQYFQYHLKGISFLPKVEKGAYKQMPYEEITEEEYQKRIKNLTPLLFDDIHYNLSDRTPDKFCDGDTCAMPPPGESEEEEREGKGKGIPEPSAASAQYSNVMNRGKGKGGVVVEERKKSEDQ